MRNGCSLYTWMNRLKPLKKLIRHFSAMKDTLLYQRRDHVMVVSVLSVEKSCINKQEILDVQKNVTMMLANLALVMDRMASQFYVCPDLMT